VSINQSINQSTGVRQWWPQMGNDGHSNDGHKQWRSETEDVEFKFINGRLWCRLKL